jgi:hypothetical protein
MKGEVRERFVYMYAWLRYIDVHGVNERLFACMVNGVKVCFHNAVRLFYYPDVFTI